MSKKSIRFFNDREVRAVWDDGKSCWWFSTTDVVHAINDEPDYTKTGTIGAANMSFRAVPERHAVSNFAA